MECMRIARVDFVDGYITLAVTDSKTFHLASLPQKLRLYQSSPYLLMASLITACEGYR